MSLLAFLVVRLREPSTYAGLGALLAVLGIHFGDVVLQAVVQVVVSIAGPAAVLMPEKLGSH